MSHKRQTEGQEALAHTRQIQKSIADHLDDLDYFCREHNFEVNVPALYANDQAHTATIEWGTNVSFVFAQVLTELWREMYKHPRLEVVFLGDVRVKDPV